MIRLTIVATPNGAEGGKGEGAERRRKMKKIDRHTPIHRLRIYEYLHIH